MPEERGRQTAAKGPEAELLGKSRVRHLSLYGDTLHLLGPDVFKAGRLKLFLDNWKEITSDETILDMVSGCHIDISENESVNEVKNMRLINFNVKEKEIVNNEVQKLLDKGVIEKTQKSEGDKISNIFIRLKKDKSYRVIINLKNLKS